MIGMYIMLCPYSANFAETVSTGRLPLMST